MKSEEINIIYREACNCTNEYGSFDYIMITIVYNPENMDIISRIAI